MTYFLLLDIVLFIQREASLEKHELPHSFCRQKILPKVLLVTHSFHSHLSDIISYWRKENQNLLFMLDVETWVPPRELWVSLAHFI